ncbi:MAG: DUF998 domain-containing protein [Thermoplasmatales archaeon]|nr:DUF998 domain-containing protein [Thermoplasmatales archaeon]MCW6169993.1 DUF998 domain-containing protein [Thermoplasmatales archaeon]
MDIGSLKKNLLWSGVVAMISAAIWIGAAIIINPSFDFFTGALSQLGSPGANYPWVYNVGLMFTSVILFAFAIALLLNSQNKVESSGSAFLMIASLFLALIGIYHGGTYPHDFVSLWFFVLADISILTWGIGMILHDLLHGAYVIAIVAVATGAGFGISWPSSAELETFGTAAIAFWAALMIVFFMRNSGKVGKKRQI